MRFAGIHKTNNNLSNEEQATNSNGNDYIILSKKTRTVFRFFIVTYIIKYFIK